jgi:hypothetical protein
VTAEQKHIHIDMSRELLPVLSVQMVRHWHDIVTLDGSWIYRVVLSYLPQPHPDSVHKKSS